MLHFKEKLQKFYGKSFSKVSKSGGYFVIATGDFLPGYAMRSYNIVDSLLTFSRVDGHHRMTAKGREQIEKAKKQFENNLNKLGIVYIDNNSSREVWERIATFFNNETAPVLKKNHEREAWIDE